MKKFPLNQKGIEKLQLILHALPNSKLSAEVLAIRLNPRIWIKTKFRLTKEESDFLDQMSKNLLDYIAIKSSSYLARRIPINFTLLENKATPYKANFIIKSSIV